MLNINPGKKGICKVCGRFSELSYEHVPPKSAFNNNKNYYISHINPLIKNRNAETFDELRKIDSKNITKKQGGIGFYSLCRNCNTNFGTWYVRAYSEWVKQSINYIEFIIKNPLDNFVVKIYPLRVLKQIVSMFFTLNYKEFSKEYPILKRFILSKESTEFDSRIRIFIYYNAIGGVLRYLPHNTILDLNLGEKPVNLSEIAFPPLGLVMTMNDGDVDPRLSEITFFSNFNYNQEVEMNQNLCILNTMIEFAGDYRTKVEIEIALKESKKFKENNPEI